MDDDNAAKLKKIFRQYDANQDGKLCFDEYFCILDALAPGSYSKSDAYELFQVMDQDLSGDMDTQEFIDWICGDDSLHHLFDLEVSVSEEEAKHALLNKPYELRHQASKTVKERGLDWSNLTWKQRLEEVRDLEKSSLEDTVKRRDKAPCRDATSRLNARRSSQPKVTTSTSGGTRATDVKAKSDSKPASNVKAPAGHFAVEDMEQAKMVEYCLRDNEISFAGYDKDVVALRDKMKAPCRPEELLDILKFIAKGTAGFVFLARDKESGTEVAMKLIRMTQAPLGVKEWYVSKILLQKGVPNVVTTYETVCVLPRNQAPAVVFEQLENAGPCPYYMCMIQELMPWGTLEDLAEEGELSPLIIFRAMEDVALGLAGMHAANVQHKDVKPENIMLEMDGDTVVAAKLCDFGSSQIGNNPAARADDIRRFGVTLFSVISGEMWTKNRLIHEKHDALVSRLTDSVADSKDPVMRRLPGVLKQILDGSMDMKQIAKVMGELDHQFGS